MQAANQFNQPASQPFPHPSVCLPAWRSIQTVSRCSCQRSILQFIIIVIDSFEWLQLRKQACQGEGERVADALVRAVTALLSIYLGPARFMRIRHGKLPETETKLVADFNV